MDNTLNMKLSLIALSINHILYLIIGAVFYFDVYGISSVSDGVNNYFLAFMIVPLHILIEIVALLAFVILLTRKNSTLTENKALFGLFCSSFAAAALATLSV